MIKIMNGDGHDTLPSSDRTERSSTAENSNIEVRIDATLDEVEKYPTAFRSRMMDIYQAHLSAFEESHPTLNPHRRIEEFERIFFGDWQHPSARWRHETSESRAHALADLIKEGVVSAGVARSFLYTMNFWDDFLNAKEQKLRDSRQPLLGAE